MAPLTPTGYAYVTYYYTTELVRYTARSQTL